MPKRPILIQPARRRRPLLRRGVAWLAACASDPVASSRLALAFVAAHVVLWTAILTLVKAKQDVHFDVAEAFDWGQRFLFGYGKHPPLSGWIAGLWFRIFPVANWSSYALAMTVCGAGLLLTWAAALKVVDRRRAFLVLVMLAIYPIFNFKGFKYNADLVQLVTLPLLVLAYLHAFEKRTAWSGVALGLAAMLALMSKYWVLTMIGAIGFAALLHPQRLAFLCSPAPWVAIATMGMAMLPHAIWLMQVDFVPLTYAGNTYTISDRALTRDLVLGYIGHNAALLALPVALASLALGWWPGRIGALISHPRGWVTHAWSRGRNSGVWLPQALNVWIVQAIVALGPPLGALAFNVYLKTDWGISLFFLVPLALVALPALRVQKAAPVRLAAIWLVLSLIVLAAAPKIADVTESRNLSDASVYGARSELARQLTEIWRARFPHRWGVVAAATDIGEPISFYSPDHPMTLAPGEMWGSRLTTLQEAKRQGFIGVCDANDAKLPTCEAWMLSHGGADVERLNITTRRIVQGKLGNPNSWRVFVARPAR